MKRPVPRSSHGGDGGEVTERILADGSVETPLHPEDIVAATDAMVAGGIGDVAVCFLHTYMNLEHENSGCVHSG